MKKYEAIKSIGVWMDYADAKFIYPGKPSSEIHTLKSPVHSRVRVSGESPDGTRLGGFRSTNNERSKNQINQNEIHAYFKQLASELLPYDEILVFGPASARKEFHHFLLNNKKFMGKRIITKPVDYITDNQLVDFVMKNLN